MASLYIIFARYHISHLLFRLRGDYPGHLFFSASFLLGLLFITLLFSSFFFCRFTCFLPFGLQDRKYKITNCINLTCRKCISSHCSESIMRHATITVNLEPTFSLGLFFPVNLQHKNFLNYVTYIYFHLFR